MLRWQPLGVRLHLPLLLLWAPFIAAVLSAVLPRSVLQVLAVVLCVAALPAVLMAPGRALVGEPNVVDSSLAGLY